MSSGLEDHSIEFLVVLALLLRQEEPNREHLFLDQQVVSLRDMPLSYLEISILQTPSQERLSFKLSKFLLPEIILQLPECHFPCIPAYHLF